MVKILEKNLTAKQELFAFHYANTLNGVKSAELAGYSGPYNAWGVVAHQNLKKPKIKARTVEYMRDLFVSPEEVIRRLVLMAQGEIPTKTTHTKKDGVFDQFDMVKATEILAKHFGLLIERTELEGEVAFTLKVKYDDPDAGANRQTQEPPRLAAPDSE